MAMLWKLPVIFVCENNGYAMGTSVQRTTNVTDIYKIGLAYDMPSEPVDGMSCESVHEAVDRAVQRARQGEGPTFLEMRTYRYKGQIGRATSELQSLMRISYAVFCLKKKNKTLTYTKKNTN